MVRDERAIKQGNMITISGVGILPAPYFFKEQTMGKLINVVKERYSTIPNEVFQDKDLDYRSKGLLCTILSLPNGWEFSIPGLVGLVSPDKPNGRSEKKDAVRTALHHLESLGYLERKPCKNSNGTFAGYDYLVHIPPKTVTD